MKSSLGSRKTKEVSYSRIISIFFVFAFFLQYANAAGVLD